MAGLIAGDLAVVPVVWRLEVINSLVVGERRKKFLREESEDFLRRIGKFRIEIDTTGLEHVFGSTLDCARKYQRSAYDASYLELSRRLGLPLATRDEPLRKAAEELGIGIFEP